MLKKESSIYKEPCKYLKSYISDIKKMNSNFIINLHKVKNSKDLLNSSEISLHIKNILLSMRAIDSDVKNSNISG